MTNIQHVLDKMEKDTEFYMSIPFINIGNKTYADHDYIIKELHKRRILERKIKRYMKQPGLLVRTADGRIGRTYKYKDFINDMISVFLTKEKNNTKFYDKPILCDPEKINIIGHIDE